MNLLDVSLIAEDSEGPIWEKWDLSLLLISWGSVIWSCPILNRVIVVELGSFPINLLIPLYVFLMFVEFLWKKERRKLGPQINYMPCKSQVIVLLSVFALIDTAEQLNRHLLIYQDTSKIFVKISSIRRNDGLNLFSPFREKKKPWFQILTQRWNFLVSCAQPELVVLQVKNVCNKIWTVFQSDFIDAKWPKSNNRVFTEKCFFRLIIFYYIPLVIHTISNYMPALEPYKQLPRGC